MRVEQKRPIVSLKQQHLIYELIENKLGWVDFASQGVYKDRSAFNKSLRILHELDIIRVKRKIIDGKLKRVVVLELQGHLFYGDYLSKIRNMSR